MISADVNNVNISVMSHYVVGLQLCEQSEVKFWGMCVFSCVTSVVKMTVQTEDETLIQHKNKHCESPTSTMA